MEIGLFDFHRRWEVSTTRYTEGLIINKHLLPRWDDVLVVEMKALDIEKWLKALRNNNMYNYDLETHAVRGNSV